MISNKDEPTLSRVKIQTCLGRATTIFSSAVFALTILLLAHPPLCSSMVLGFRSHRLSPSHSFYVVNNPDRLKSEEIAGPEKGILALEKYYCRRRLVARSILNEFEPSYFVQILFLGRQLFVSLLKLVSIERAEAFSSEMLLVSPTA